MKKSVFFILGMVIPFMLFCQQNDLSSLEAIGELSEGLIAVKKDGKWGFINTQNNLVIDFRVDIAPTDYQSFENQTMPMFKDDRCPITTMKDGIPYYGFIDRSGATVIEPRFLNVTSFENGHAIAIYVAKTVRGKNEYMDMDILQYTFAEVVIDTSGKIVKNLQDLPRMQMSEERYEKPYSESRFVSKDQIAIETDGVWEIIVL